MTDEEDSKIFFTSDTHFGHHNIIKYMKLDYKDAHEMDEDMIQKWNAKIRPRDRVYHLGDFSFHHPEKIVNIARRLNGNKFLILGNHDRAGIDKVLVPDHFAWARHYYSLRVPAQKGVEYSEKRKYQKIILFHYPIASWHHNHYGAWHLHGHCHGSFPEVDTARYMDVGVHTNNMTPYSLEEVAEHMRKKTFEPVDHHGQPDHKVK